MGKRKKQEFSTSKAVRDVVHIDGTKNKGGRPVGSTNKGMPDYRRTKTGLIEAFNKSNAPGIITGMLNGNLPSFLRPENRTMLTVEEDVYFRKLILKNFMWAADYIAKIVPRELGRHGQVVGEMSLAELTRRATVSPKSPEVVDMVAERRADEVESFVAEEINE